MYGYSSDSQTLCLSLPITLQQRAIAQQFASEQINPDKRKKIKLNTIAIFAVKNYLDLMGINSSLEESDSWNFAVRSSVDIADLEIMDVGKLECIAIAPNTSVFTIPEEVREDRIGYVIVEVSETRSPQGDSAERAQATLRGFIKQAEDGEIPLDRVLSLESLLDRIDEYQHLVNLKKWLNNIFEKDWQPVTEILPSALATFNFRLQSKDAERCRKSGYAEAGKLIDLGINLKGFPVALVLDFVPEDEMNTSIRVQVHPSDRNLFLPPNLQLTVLDEDRNVFLEAKSRERDNYLQLLFSGRSREEFALEIAFEERVFIERFVI